MACQFQHWNGIDSELDPATGVAQENGKSATNHGTIVGGVCCNVIFGENLDKTTTLGW
jgi:hypothetical protein